MRSSSKVHLNVPLSPEVYSKVKAFMASKGLITNASFIEQAVQEADWVFLDFVEINGAPRESGTALFQLGDRFYKWTGASFIEMAPATMNRLVYERGA